MNTPTEKKTLSQIAYEAQAGNENISWEDSYPINKRIWERTAAAVREAVLTESKLATDVLHTSLVTLSMEVTKMEALREELRQKDLIIQDLRNSKGEAIFGALAELYQAPASSFAPYAGPDITPPPTPVRTAGEWKLPEPPEGQQWHRTDRWTKEMLPEGWRPHTFREGAEHGDEYWNGKTWYACPVGGFASAESCHTRTRRPLPTPQAPEEGKPSHIQNIDKALKVAACIHRSLSLRNAQEAADTAKANDKSIMRGELALEKLKTEFEQLSTRAEQAEKKLAEVENERDVWKASSDGTNKILNATQSLLDHNTEEGLKYLNRVRELEAELSRLSASPWIPSSVRLPTISDADKNGCVWIPNTTAFQPIAEIHYTNVGPGRCALWMTPIPLPSESPEADPVERACEVMHDAYEAAAPSAGWKTQEASRKPWKDVPEANKATMRAAVQALLSHLASTNSTK